MKTNSIRAFLLGPVLFAAAVGLAVTASGCVVDTGPGYGVNCESDLIVPWQIQNEAGAAVTCDAAGAATVVVSFTDANNGQTNFPQPCQAGRSAGSQDILLQQNYSSYDLTVNLYDGSGNPLAVPQEATINVNSCGTYTTPGPALLVVTPQ